MGRSHIVSWFIRKLVEHRRFRPAVAVFGVIAVFITSMLSIGNKAQAFSANDFKANILANEETVLTTKRTSRLPVAGTVSQGFTYYHPGIDIEDGFNEPVYPFLQGTVVETGFQAGGYGNYVLIDHQNGYFSLYAHLNKVLIEKGDETSSDSQIGTVGVTGRSTGSHLHFEVYENSIAINPLTILPELAFSSASGNPKVFVGGPASIPSRTLILPISSQASYVFEDSPKETKHKDKFSLSFSQQDLPSSATRR